MRSVFFSTQNQSEGQVIINGDSSNGSSHGRAARNKRRGGRQLWGSLDGKKASKAPSRTSRGYSGGKGAFAAGWEGEPRGGRSVQNTTLHHEVLPSQF